MLIMTSAIDEARKLAAEVDGWLDDREGVLLFELAKNCQGRGTIVEIGSWKGKSTIWLGKGSMAGRKVKVWAIDPHTGSDEHRQVLGAVNTFDEFMRNIARSGLDGLVAPIVKSSKDAAKGFEGPVEFVFIDGAHDYESVKTDFEVWFPKVVEGGTVAFHDVTGWDGPRKVVLEKLCTSRSFGATRLVGSIAYSRKVRQNSIQERIRNRLMLFVIGPSVVLRGILPRPVRLMVRKAAAAAGIFR